MRQKKIVGLERVRAIRALLLLYGIVVIKHVLTWFELYRYAGYNSVTLKATPAVTLFLGFALANPFVSWLFFGSICVMSGSLRPAAFAHASTDYALLPAITDRPLLGAIFVLTNGALAWWMGPRHRSGRQRERVYGCLLATSTRFAERRHSHADTIWR